MQETPDYAGIAGRLEATCHEACSPQACNALRTTATVATAERELLHEMSEIEMEPIDVASDLEWMNLERTELDAIDIDKLIRDA